MAQETERPVNLTAKPLGETESSPTLMLKGAANKESSSEILIEEEFKKLSTSEGEKLKDVTTAEGNEKKKTKLKTKDDVIFEVDHFIAKEMKKVQSLIEENGGDDAFVVEISDVSSHSLSQIIDYYTERHRVAEADNTKEKLKLVDEKFVERMKMNELKKLLLAAKNLDMKNFMEFMINSVAKAIKNKNVEFVRDFFGVKNDFTPEEEAEHKKAHAWAFRNIDQD